MVGKAFALRCAGVCLALLMAACGGGGQSGPAEQFHLSGTSVNFTASVNDSRPPAGQTLTGSITGVNSPVYLFVEYTNRSLDQVNVSLTGGNAGQINFWPKAPSPLGVGTFTDTVTVRACTNPEGTANLVGSPKTITVTYTVSNNLRADADSMDFTQVLGGTAPADKSLNLSGNGLSWTASANASWVKLRSTQGSAPSALAVGVDATGLAPGSHTTTLQVATQGSSDVLTIPVTLTVAAPALAPSPTVLAGGGLKGRDLSPLALQVAFNTGGNAYAWTASADRSWIQLGATSGTASGNAPASLQVGWNVAGLAPGSHTGSITLNGTVQGQAVTATVPVTLSLDSHRLVAEDGGVALTSMPGLARTQTTLGIRDSLGLASPWTAQADQPWLTVTTSGTTPGNLVFTANPSGLAVNTVHHATVTLTPASGDVSAETVQVGFWVGSAQPQAFLTLSETHTTLALDPVRPYAYAHPFNGRDLKVYNIYTGAVVTTLHFPGTGDLGGLAVSPDGARLFVQDLGGQTIVPVDLPAFTIGTPWPGAPTGIAQHELVALRTQGRSLLAVTNGHIYDAADGRDWGELLQGAWQGQSMTASRDGSRVVFQNTGFSPSTFRGHSVDYSALLGAVQISGFFSGSGGSNGQDVALNGDGSRLYTANGAPYCFYPFDLTQPSGPVQLPYLNGNAYPNNVEVSKDGRIFCGASVWYDEKDIWIYAADGTLLNSLRAGGYARATLKGQMKISGEGLRLVVLTEIPTLAFITVGP